MHGNLGMLAKDGVLHNQAGGKDMDVHFVVEVTREGPAG